MLSESEIEAHCIALLQERGYEYKRAWQNEPETPLRPGAEMTAPRLPKRKIIEFNLTIAPYFDTMRSNCLQIRALDDARDALLKSTMGENHENPDAKNRKLQKYS